MRAWAPTILPVPLADTLPIGEMTGGQIGTGQKATRDDHRHPRLTSAQWGTTDANGEVTYTFTRSFSAKPAICFTYEEAANNQPIETKVKSWVQDGGGNYTGCVAKAYRVRPLPSSLTLITQLISFSVTIDAPAGIPVSCIALQIS